ILCLAPPPLLSISPAIILNSECCCFVTKLLDRKLPKGGDNVSTSFIVKYTPGKWAYYVNCLPYGRVNEDFPGSREHSTPLPLGSSIPGQHKAQHTGQSQLGKF
ncbi:mCG144556, partial [Mus musculus]